MLQFGSSFGQFRTILGGGMKYSRFLNEISMNRIFSPIRKLTELIARGGEGMISFGTGAPNASCFPFQNIEVKTKSGERLQLNGALLNKALQYGPTKGIPELLDWLKEMQTDLQQGTFFGTDEDSLDMIITPGSQDGLCKIFEMTLNRGDPVLIENPTYPGTLTALRPFTPRFLSIHTDRQGLDPNSMEKILKENIKHPPKILYVQPNCSNPTGVSIPVERRKEILQLANKYNILIIEDDPYYFLNFEKFPPASFLSLDETGRVLRLDSFSKVISSGLRLGFVTGSKPLIERIMLHLQVSSMQCSSLSQTIVYQLLATWGHAQFLAHTRKVAAFYEHQCNMMIECVEKYLGDLVEWERPPGGMFLWLKAKNIKDTSRLINEKALEKKVILAPGNIFNVDPNQPSPYMRASFSAASQTDMETGFQRLAELLRSEETK